MLVDKKHNHRIHIVLDASKVNRCDWCGSPESDKWINSDLGVFCSEECSKAKYSNIFPLAVFVTLILPLMTMTMWFLPDSLIELSSKLLGVISFTIMEIMMIAIVISDSKDRRYALEIPKGSRRDIGVSKVALLRRVSAPIECPNCDAIIDLKDVGEDMIYTCQYCGANGTVEIAILE